MLLNTYFDLQSMYGLCCYIPHRNRIIGGTNNHTIDEEYTFVHEECCKP